MQRRSKRLGFALAPGMVLGGKVEGHGRPDRRWPVCCGAAYHAAEVAMDPQCPGRKP